MNAQPFILRSTLQGVAAASTGPMLSWIPGTVQPFSSLWMVAQRFAVLNQPSKPEFDKDFGELKKTKAHGVAGAEWEPPPLALQQAQMHGIARLLGEAPEVFQRARLSQFPRAAHQFFHPELWWCWDCLVGGFHSVLFSLKGLHKCPHHKMELAMSCRCNRRVGHDSFAARLVRPGHCTCGMRFLGARMARRPQVLPDRDACLKDLNDWITGATRRIWYQLPDKLTTYPISFRRHLKHWEQALLVSPPPATWCVPPDVQIHQVGPWSPQLHLAPGQSSFRASLALRRSTSPQAQAPAHEGEFSCAPIFKSVRRYIAHHVLIDGRHWITSMAMSSDSDKISSMVQFTERTRGAWTTLLWWQACVGSLSLRDWFRSCRTDVYDEKRFERDVLARGGQDLAWLSSAELGWIRHHLYAASLMFLWDSAQRVTAQTVAGFGATWGWGASASERYPLRKQAYHAPGWSCVKDERGRLSLLVDTPRIDWTPAPSGDRSIRRKQAMQREEARRLEIRTCCERSCICYHARTQDWLVGAGPTPSGPQDYRRRRLGGDEPQVFFLVLHTAQDGSKAFVGRCRSLPLAASAETPKAAIAALKWALQHYRKYRPPVVDN